MESLSSLVFSSVREEQKYHHLWDSQGFFLSLADLSCFYLVFPFHQTVWKCFQNNYKAKVTLTSMVFYISRLTILCFLMTLITFDLLNWLQSKSVTLSWWKSGVTLLAFNMLLFILEFTIKHTKKLSSKGCECFCHKEMTIYEDINILTKYVSIKTSYNIPYISINFIC